MNFTCTPTFQKSGFLIGLMMALITLLPSCGDFEDGAGQASYFTGIMGKNTGHFRGVKIGATQSEVLNSEPSEPKYLEDGTYIVFEYPLDGNDTYSVTYDLNDDILYAIQVLVTVRNEDVANNLFKDFTDQFGRRFGEAQEMEERHGAWIFSSGESEEIEVTLDNESQGSNGQLSIRFYDFEY